MAKYCPYCTSRIETDNTCPYCNYSYFYHPKAHHLKPGTLLHKKYMVGRVLGEGGFGITYLGRDLTLDMKVAIKEYFPTSMVTRSEADAGTISLFDWSFSPSFKAGKEQFISEAQTIAKMDKESAVVTVRDYFEENNSAYIVMEFIEGCDLKTILERAQKPIPMQDLLEYLEPVFEALSELHGIGLVHRDISPDNIMIENGRARLIDFGCARESFLTGEGSDRILKHCFSPIEQYENRNIGPWTDVYAMAATIYYCITGRLPPRAPDRQLKVELASPTSLGIRLPRKQERALMKALSVRSEDRYQSMSDFGKDLFIRKSPYKPVVIGAGVVIALTLAAFLVLGLGTQVEHLSMRRTVPEILTTEDSISEEERKMLQQVSDLIAKGTIQSPGDSSTTEYAYTLINSTDYDFESLRLVFRRLNEKGAIESTNSSSSITDFKKGNTSKGKTYLKGEPGEFATVQAMAIFSTEDRTFRTDYVEMPLMMGEERDSSFSIQLVNKLPDEFSWTNWSGTVKTYSITAATSSTRSTLDGYSVTFSISGECVSGDERINGQLDYRLTSVSGAVVSTGSLNIPKLSKGDRFDNVKLEIYSLPAGEYRLELLDRDSRN